MDSHWLNTYRNEIIEVFVLFSPLVVLAFFVGWQPVEPGLGDPNNIVTRSQRIVENKNVWITSDPPLRYVPLALLLGLTDASGPLAEKVIHLYTTSMSFVVIPLTLYVLFGATADHRIGLLTVGGIILQRLLGIGRYPYVRNNWQYTYTIPFVFLALLFAHLSLEASESRRGYLMASLSGIAIGITGLNQYILGGLTAGIVGLAYLYQQKWKYFGLTASVGTLFASVLLTAPQGMVSGMFGTGQSRLCTETGQEVVGCEPIGIELVTSGIWVLFTTPSYLFLLVMMSCVSVYVFVSNNSLSESHIVEIAIIILVLFWAPFIVLKRGVWYYASISHFVLQYLLFGSLVHALHSWMRQHNISEITGSIR